MDTQAQATDNPGDAGSSSEIKSKNTPKCRHQRSMVRPPKSDFRFVQIMLNFIHPVLLASGKFRICYFTYGILDHWVMAKAEKVLAWCVPDLSPQKADNKHRPMTRPLPWLLILPTLIAIRIFRFNLSFFSVMFRKGEVSTSDMMNSLKGFRRYIRGIRCNASKRKEASELEKEAERRKYVLWRAYYKIKDLIFVNSAVPVCSNRNYDDHEHTRKRLLSSDGSDTDSDEELNVNELLDKYSIKAVPDDEENDPTYQPEEDQEEVSSSSSISDTSIDQKEPEKLKEDLEKDISELVAKEVIKEILANGFNNEKKINDDNSHKANGDVSPKLNGDNAHAHQNGSPKENGHHHHSDMPENNHKENEYKILKIFDDVLVLQFGPTEHEIYYTPIGTPTEDSHQNQNGHHNDESPSASLDSPHTRSKSKAAKKPNVHHKRQQFQKYKAKSLVQKNKDRVMKRQNSSPIPTIVVTEH